MRPGVFDWIGWVATAPFACSYFQRSPAALRRTQAAAAAVWLLYGLAIGALPVIVANAVVAALAVYSSFRQPRGRGSEGGADREVEMPASP
jgi:hypothetical protein